ncbi:MarR family winged helix-turn-helix transcriptional regulator [Pseudaminobacter soli (ex Li et al. 2025)]|uniref:MarR family transcriptional regulator n=1 Tax=Pseudaminobacter soli (ex Li et al. 2025) TaxID=1295366 RepID=A0A2P7SIV3_9HYPH|nr:MarR family transcriptional regulator [Mesorhizobium soli]PSJ62426.1 MarR family transcriptional regulator [Mesorhizobium soli]
MTAIPARELLLDELSKVSRKMRTLFDARVRERGLTLARARTLMRISDGQAVNQKELAEELEIENATLVRLIDGLETQGLIERRAVDTDRRAKQVAMTTAGEAAADLVMEMARGLRRDLLAGIDDADLDVTLDVLRRMAQNIEGSGTA